MQHPLLRLHGRPWKHSPQHEKTVSLACDVIREVANCRGLELAVLHVRAEALLECCDGGPSSLVPLALAGAAGAVRAVELLLLPVAVAVPRL